MIWTDGETWEEEKRRKGEWHKYFAWFPVTIRVENGHKIKAWLQYVERKGYFCWAWMGGGFDWEYREI